VDWRENGRCNHNGSDFSIMFVHGGRPGFPVWSFGIDLILEGIKISMPCRESKVHCPMITRRERSILYLVAEGYKNEEIAEELTISEKTVKGAQVNLMRKWGAPNVSSVIDHALEAGLITVYGVLESRFSRRNARAN
jgi:DNA-binding CsgD family transcriptional regulator